MRHDTRLPRQRLVAGPPSDDAHGTQLHHKLVTAETDWE
jgi:hypothetical protein